MRESDPTPRRTSLTRAPTCSQSSAISFMNEMRVASMALAAYLVQQLCEAPGSAAELEDRLRGVEAPVANQFVGRDVLVQCLRVEEAAHAIVDLPGLGVGEGSR